LKDSALLAKESSGGLIANEAKYQAKCLASFYKQAAAVDKCSVTDHTNCMQLSGESIEFAQLVEYIT
jgi:hypothetical protein